MSFAVIQYLSNQWGHTGECPLSTSLPVRFLMKLFLKASYLCGTNLRGEETCLYLCFPSCLENTQWPRWGLWVWERGQGGMVRCKPAGRSGRSWVSCGKDVGRRRWKELVEKHLPPPQFSGEWVGPWYK